MKYRVCLELIVEKCSSSVVVEADSEQEAAQMALDDPPDTWGRNDKEYEPEVTLVELEEDGTDDDSGMVCSHCHGPIEDDDVGWFCEECGEWFCDSCAPFEVPDPPDPNATIVCPDCA